MSGTRSDVPTFAVVGAVNHGKSSVVAALAEDDAVRISTMPGETVATQRFALDDLLVFFDTPGFQNARKARSLIASPAALRDFVARHRDDPAFEAECRLLRPIVDGAGVIYVVDASRPWRDIHRSEIELLRMTDAPRLALLHHAAGEHADIWRTQLATGFDAIQDFDSHRATFDDRRALLDALARVAPWWAERLRRAVEVMARERDQRIDEAATRVSELVIACVRHVEKTPLDGATDRERARSALRQRYVDALAALEGAAHRELIALFAHHRVEPDATPVVRFGLDLFAEETWALFGLDARQLIALSSVAGGVAGVGVDAALLGHSLGLGAMVGAATGAGGAWLLGKRRPTFALRAPGLLRSGVLGRIASKSAWRIGGGDLAIGPAKAENFPWIVIDRALCLFAEVEARSHARRDATVIDVERILPRLDDAKLSVKHWSDAQRSAAQRVFKITRAGRSPSVEERAGLRMAIHDALVRIANERGATR